MGIGMRRIIFLETTKAAKDGLNKLEKYGSTTDEEYTEAGQNAEGRLAAKYFAMAKAMAENDPENAKFYHDKADSHVRRGQEIAGTIANPESSENPRERRFEKLKRARQAIYDGRKAGVIRNPLN